jgi:hypothetical protein
LREHWDRDYWGARSIRRTKRLRPEVACTEIAVDAIARERTSIVFSCRLSATERRRDVCAQDVEMYSIRAGVVCNECGGGGR